VEAVKDVACSGVREMSRILSVILVN